jgi:hypothetical protein
MTGLIGSQIRVHVDPRDLRSVKAFLPGAPQLLTPSLARRFGFRAIFVG